MCNTLPLLFKGNISVAHCVPLPTQLKELLSNDPGSILFIFCKIALKKTNLLQMLSSDYYFQHNRVDRNTHANKRTITANNTAAWHCRSDAVVARCWTADIQTGTEMADHGWTSAQIQLDDENG